MVTPWDASSNNSAAGHSAASGIIAHGRLVKPQEAFHPCHAKTLAAVMLLSSDSNTRRPMEYQYAQSQALRHKSPPRDPIRPTTNSSHTLDHIQPGHSEIHLCAGHHQPTNSVIISLDVRPTAKIRVTPPLVTISHTMCYNTHRHHDT
ncbi:hypothetical protein WUBG_02801 [Wuchereria bancrofti]|uniref:Uncharacterized protein n=1 Tax=Wuchereria bancrofti TaxID=6293 RepID=J9EUM0_WUCBA|nr:hypothetical protein WUBG_02801 [Wuchereria bancrofti]